MTADYSKYHLFIITEQHEVSHLVSCLLVVVCRLTDCCSLDPAADIQ